MSAYLKTRDPVLDAGHEELDVADDFFMKPDDILLGPIVGSGQFGNVHYGRYFGDPIAIKIQKLPKNVSISKGTLSTYLLRELSVLKNARHENLLEYIGACETAEVNEEDPATLYIVTEFAANGDLLHLLSSDAPLGWNFLTRIILGAMDGLHYLHDKGIIHRDIKSENILLDGNWCPKVSDFGMAREVGGGAAREGDQRAKHQFSICGTDQYMAPELMFDESYGYPVDIFSFGLVIFEMLARTPIGKDGFCERFPGKNFRLDYDEIKTKLLQDVPNSFVELAIVCSDYEPEDRPLSVDAVEWIADLLKMLQPDEEDQPESKEEPEVEEDDLTSVTVRNSTLGVDISEGDRERRNSESSAASSSTTKEDERKVGFAVTKQISDRVIKASPAMTPAKMKMGWLYKKNRSGFRNWKKRWFVLKGPELSWFGSPDEVFSGATWGTPHGTIQLKNNVLIKGKSGCRFQILDCDDMDVNNDDRLHNREVAALNAEDLEEWLAALEDHIEEANRGGVKKRTSTMLPQKQDAADAQVTSPIPSVSEDSTEGDLPTSDLIRQASSVFGAFKSIEDWLKSLGLREYHKNFASNTNLTMKIIEEVGLSKKDLDELIIKDDFARRLILQSCRGGFQPELTAEVNGARDFGDVIVYRVNARYKTRRSVVYLRFSDFVKIQAKVRVSCSDRPKLLSALPSLPGKGIWESRMGNRTKAFVSERQKALRIWLKSTIAVVQKEPDQLNLLLMIMELHIMHN